jgi:PKD domain
MSGKSRMGILTAALAAALALLTLGASLALGSGPASSPLPGYPRFRGVLLVHDGSSASIARQKAIASALKVASSSTQPNCTVPGAKPGADLCWWGGPVVKAHTVHIIFWEGPSGHPFLQEYIETVENYFTDIASASATVSEENSSVYAVGTQYEGSNGPVTFKVSFHGAPDVLVDKVNALPAAGSLSTQCKDASLTTCVTDEDLHKEIEAAQLLKGWSSSREDIYFVLTPANVGSCFEPGSSSEGDVCAFVPGGYCAYHGDFGTTGKERLYANIPDVADVEGCDSFEHPNGSSGVDATLDTISHEHNETITDPLEAEPAWLDIIGQEVGDKCLPPETFDIYGAPLGGSLEAGTTFNQEIGAGRYWLQREWSNRATGGEGACVTRMLHTDFTFQAEAKATVPVTFDGSGSGESGDPATYWVWSFGDKVQVGTPESSVTHTYATPGSKIVTLTAYDEYGNSNTRRLEVTIGPAPPPATPTAPPTPITIKEVIKEAIVPGRYTPAQVAAALGLPANGRKLSGFGPFSFDAQCPPACGVTLRLYARETRMVHKHRTSKWVLVGSAHLTLAAKGAGPLTLSLNAKGKALLRKTHTLAAKLVATVEGQEGGSWQIERTLTLSAGGKPVRRARH